MLLAMRGVVSVLAMLALGYYKYAKFAILAHHSLHGGWGTTRRGWYANGAYRRFVDWLDWIFPMAWVVEHNKWHHYRLNEDADPDFVERNLETVRAAPVPTAVKLAIVAVQMSIWKWYYYASNTLKLLHSERKDAPQKLDETMVTLSWTIYESIRGHPWYRAVTADLLFRVLGPPALLHMVLLPVLAACLQLLFGVAQPSALLGVLPFCWAALLNAMGAELITNVHAFATIVTNHAGVDLWGFEGTCGADTPEFYLRAVLGSVAYHAGSDLVDFFHGYLNYQAEHHAFPALSPLHYQRLHPHFKRVCAKHGVPYVQEPVWVRVKKTVDVMIGHASMPRIRGNACEQPHLWCRAGVAAKGG